MKGNLSLQELCTELEKEELIELVLYLSNQYAGIDMDIMEWYTRQKRVGKKEVVFNQLLWDSFDRAEEIIRDFNTYGGGPEYLEHEVYGYLQNIMELVIEYALPTKEKHVLIKRLFIQYEMGNSGLDDVIMDTIYGMCQSDLDWKYVITLLEKLPDEWNQKLIMQIYKNELQDDEAYLQLRMQYLDYGMDYWDLAEYYISIDQVDKAAEIAGSGLENGKGRQTELFAFLFDYYVSREDTNKIHGLIDKAFYTESDIDLISERAFLYFKMNNDYEEVKNILVRTFRTSSYRKQYYEDFNFLKEQLTAKDWEEIQEEMIGIVKKESIVDYLKICYENERYSEMLEILQKAQGGMSPYNMYDQLDHFANQLIDEYPQEIVEYYWNKGCILVPEGNRKRYKEAVKYFVKVRDILKNKLDDEESWQYNVTTLRMQHKKKKAFLDEMKIFG
ncbi:hypothetical protein P4V58_13700 [Bacillus wiedmannii]|uniref:hypothetical protein n=1 Tax=Bacillus wiedmannii TaxID=1890302 RepID=UPI002E1EDE95|nr:hypothetical protein [Bacillus wiedmannii]